MTAASEIKPLTTLAYSWRLDRRDGITLGFTSHDSNVEIDGITYLASPGMEPTSIVQSEGLEAGGLDVRGALTADAISEDDLRAGRWNRAKIQIFLFDWENPSGDTTILASGELGSISYSGSEFEAELFGLADLLSEPVVPATSPSCRATFCDTACGLNRHRFEHLVRVDSVSDTAVTLQGSSPVADGDLAYGQLRWLSGTNTGIIYDISNNNGLSIELTARPKLPVSSGDCALLIEGCNKTLDVCRGRFGNTINFRGEPFLPGNDLLTRYPGAN